MTIRVEEDGSGSGVVIRVIVVNGEYPDGLLLWSHPLHIDGPIGRDDIARLLRTVGPYLGGVDDDR